MNSSQINFYALPDDLLDIQNWALTQGLVFIKVPFFDKDSMINNDILNKSNSNEWENVFLCREKDIDKIEVKFIFNLNHFLINSLESPVIEFTRSFLKGSELNRSRLYFVSKFWRSNGDFISKDPDFIAFAKKFIKNFKRTFLHRFKTDQADWATMKFIEFYETNKVKLTL